jgi:mannose-1-phosphate guanylyltransferase
MFRNFIFPKGSERGHTRAIYYGEVISKFHEMPDISIDYAVMERSSKGVSIPVDLYWSDIGSWDSVFEVLEKDENGNAFQGDVLGIEISSFKPAFVNLIKQSASITLFIGTYWNL